jgi:hypothetical protein
MNHSTFGIATAAARCGAVPGLAGQPMQDAQANTINKATALDIAGKEAAECVAHAQILLRRIADVADRALGAEPDNKSEPLDGAGPGSLAGLAYQHNLLRLVLRGLERQVERIERL